MCGLRGRRRASAMSAVATKLFCIKFTLQFNRFFF